MHLAAYNSDNNNKCNAFISKDPRLRNRRQAHREDQAATGESSRPMRSTRQTLNRSNGMLNPDSDDDSDDDRCLSQIASQNRPKRSPRGSAANAPLSTEFVDTTSPPQQNGHFLKHTRETIRRRQISSTINSTITTTPTSITSSSSSHQSTLTRSMTTSETSLQIERRRTQVSYSTLSISEHFIS